MFRHVVLLKLTADATPEQHQAVLDGLSALPAAIPELRSYQMGSDAGLVPEGNFDLAIVADFDDMADYEIYRDNPQHQDVIARCIKPILASRAAVQHELT
jgi:hypothetical protein